MSYEHPDFRGILERLNEKYPDKEMLSVQDLADLYGYSSRQSVYNRFGSCFQRGKISKVKLARLMCMNNKELKQAKAATR